MESVIPNMEKAEENYKVPNLEKGIAVLEYLSLHTQGETSYVPFYPLAGKTFRFALFGSGKGDHGLFAEYSPGPIFVLYGIYTLQRPDYYYT